MATNCIVDPDDLDEKGLLKDGRSLRVPVYMRDNATVADIPASLDGLSVQDRAVVLADIGARFGRRSGYAFADSDADRITRMRARDAYAKGLNDAWRSLDGEPGDACTAAGGQPGRVCKEGGALVCRPLASKEPTDREWAMAGPLSDAEAVTLKDTALREYEERVQNAWRR